MLFRRISLAAIAALTCLFAANDVMAQGRGGFGGGESLQFLNNPEVQAELDLVDEQIEDLKDIGNEAREVMRNAFSGMREKFRDLSGDERDELMSEIRAKIQEDMKSVEEKLGEILVPHQLERLNQITLQSQMRRSGTAGALKNEKWRKAAGLSEEDAEKLMAKEEEVKKKLEEDIKALRSKAQDEVLSVLSADKQKKLKEMIGESFEVSRNSWGRRGGGDRGGRRGGGRRGGGGDRGGF